MSFWGRLFGSDDAAGKLIDNVSSGIDKLWYTDEEKSDDKRKSTTEARTMVIEWLKNTQGQNLSRRLIALSITFTWLTLHLVNAILGIVATWSDKINSEKLLLSADIVRTAASDMVPAVMLILGFYFAAPHMGNIAEAALNRFGQKNDKNP